MMKMKMCIERKDNMIGETIKKCRLYNNLSMKKLGIMVGFTEENAASRIYQYEVGRCVPCPEIAERIAKVLGISKDAILPIDISTEKGILHTLLHLISRKNIALQVVGELCVLTFPKELEYVKQCLSHYSHAKALCTSGIISENELAYIAHSIDTYKDISDDFIPVKLEGKNLDNFQFANDLLGNGEIIVIEAGSREEANQKLKEYLKETLPDEDDELSDYEEGFFAPNNELGVSDEEYNGMLIEKLCDDLSKEMTKEYNAWLGEIQKLTPAAIVNTATEIFIKEQIIESVKDADYMNIKMLTALLQLDNPLQECYEHWFENKEVISDISEIISDLAYKTMELVDCDEVM